MMKITKKAAVLGWPINHSRSPLIHNYWLNKYQIEGSYEKIAVAPEDLEAFVKLMPEQGFVGANLTIPHKEAIFKIADQVDDISQTIEAANTMWWDNGQLCVTNTDAAGFMAHLSRTAPKWNQNSAGCVAVLGAGGAARGVVYGLLKAGVEEIRIFNRTRERAIELSHHFDVRIKVEDWDNRSERLAECHTLINTTSLGMVGHPPLEIDLSMLAEKSVVFDIVYAPLETALLAQARQSGHIAIDGLGMLLHQAAPAFGKWFGQRPGISDELRALVVQDLES